MKPAAVLVPPGAAAGCTSSCLWLLLMISPLLCRKASFGSTRITPGWRGGFHRLGVARVFETCVGPDGETC